MHTPTRTSGPAAAGDEGVGELVGAAVELAIGEGLALELDGDAVGGALHLGLDELVQAGVERVRRLGAVPVDQELLALGRGEQRQRPDGLIGAGDHGLEHDAEVFEHASRGGRVEQIGVVLEQQADARAVGPGVEGEVELGLDPLLRGEQIEGGEAGRQSGEPGIGGAFQKVEHDLEERTAAEVPLGLELLDELLEGEVLVGVGLQRRLAHAPEKAAHAGVPRQVGAEDEGVDEEADERLDLGAGAVGDRDPDEQVLLAGVAASTAVKPASSVMKRVEPSAVPGRADQSPARAAAHAVATPPRVVWQEGRGRSVGRSSTGSGARRRSRQ